MLPLGLAGLGRLLRRLQVLSELPADGPARGHGAAAAMTRKNTAPAHPSPGSGASEAEVEGMTPMASSTPKKANANDTAATPA
jgi:hypothetical protein